jgi:hypothetical protein
MEKIKIYREKLRILRNVTRVKNQTQSQKIREAIKIIMPMNGTQIPITSPTKKIGSMSKFINLCEAIEYFTLKEYSNNARFAVFKGVLVALHIICDVRLYRRVNNSCEVPKVPTSFTFRNKQYKTLITTLPNAVHFSPNYTASHPKRLKFSTL